LTPRGCGEGTEEFAIAMPLTNLITSHFVRCFHATINNHAPT